MLAFIYRTESAYHQGDERFTPDMRKILLDQLASAALKHMQGKHDKCLRASDPRRLSGGVFELLGYDCKLWDPESPESVAASKSRKAKDKPLKDPEAISWMKKYLFDIAQDESIITKGMQILIAAKIREGNLNLLVSRNFQPQRIAQQHGHRQGTKTQ